MLPIILKPQLRHDPSPELEDRFYMAYGDGILRVLSSLLSRLYKRQASRAES